MKKSTVVSFAVSGSAALLLAAVAGTALAGTSTRSSTACVNPNLHVMTLMTTVSVDCAPNGSDEISQAAIVNNTGAMIPKGTTIYWADKFQNGAVGPKGHATIVSDLAPNASQIVGTPTQGRNYTCTAVFFDLK